MSSYNTQYTPVAQVMSQPEAETYHDFALFDVNEPSTHASGNSPLFSNKDAIFLQQAYGKNRLFPLGLTASPTFPSTRPLPYPFSQSGLLDLQPETTQANDQFNFNFDITLTPFAESHFDTPENTPFSEFYPTPILKTPYFTPFETPYQDFEQDPLLSPAIAFNEFEKDEGYGTTDYKRIFSPDHFDGNPSTLLHTTEKPIIDFEAAEYDPEETTGNLIEPLGNTGYMDDVSSLPPPEQRKRKSSSSDCEPVRRFSCKHPGCDKAFARLFNLNTHAKTHDPNREKPFACKECAKSFARKHDLFRHEASVHRGERLFTCKRCSKPFSRKDALRRHVAIKGCPGTGSVADNDIDMDSGVSTSGSEDSSAEA